MKWGSSSSHLMVLYEDQVSLCVNESPQYLSGVGHVVTPRARLCTDLAIALKAGKVLVIPL